MSECEAAALMVLRHDIEEYFDRDCCEGALVDFINTLKHRLRQPRTTKTDTLSYNYQNIFMEYYKIDACRKGMEKMFQEMFIQRIYFTTRLDPNNYKHKDFLIRAANKVPIHLEIFEETLMCDFAEGGEVMEKYVRVPLLNIDSDRHLHSGFHFLGTPSKDYCWAIFYSNFPFGIFEITTQ